MVRIELTLGIGRFLHPPVQTALVKLIKNVAVDFSLTDKHTITAAVVQPSYRRLLLYVSLAIMHSASNTNLR